MDQRLDTFHFRDFLLIVSYFYHPYSRFSRYDYDNVIKVNGEVLDDSTSWDLPAALPVGTLTGAPKVW